MRPLLQSVGDDMTAMLPHDLLSRIIKPKATAPTDEAPAEGDAPDDKATPATAAPDADSPAPLPVPRGGNTGGKQP